MQIAYVNLQAQWKDERAELLPIIESVLESGSYVGGEEIKKFERSVAKLCGTKYAIALNSGTDALVYALKALKIGLGDEVITPPNSFIASTAAIMQVGATPVFVDVQSNQNIDVKLIEKSITGRTRAIMPVHLTGRMADMHAINRIASNYNLAIIEDAAQAIGSLFDQKPSGSMGSVGCFSTHPLKNLNACGDGGFVTTNDEKIAEKVYLLRNHGITNRNTVQSFGMVSRMDSLQAAILYYRLGKLSTVIRKRRHNAQMYNSLLDQDHLLLPTESDKEFNTYHTFVIQTDDRDQLQEHLHTRGIGTTIHYPTPIHLQPAASGLGHVLGDFPVTERQASRILTLPVHQYLSEANIHYICKNVNEYFNTSNDQ